jgi:hypothetical protein
MAYRRQRRPDHASIVGWATLNRLRGRSQNSRASVFT